MRFLDRYFDIAGRRTTVAAETRGAVATFLTMAYILVANPTILSAAGVPFEAAVAATALTAALCSAMMGLTANMPIAVAPGMGLNAVVAYQLAPVTGSWQAAMGLVAIEGLLVLILVVAGLRETVMSAIPLDLRRAIGGGIGLFIAFIGIVNARLVVVPAGTVTALARDPGAVVPPVAAGSLAQPEALLALGGLLLMGLLIARRQPGALLIGMGAVTAAALVSGLTTLPPGSWWRVPHLGTFGQADLDWAMQAAAIPLILSLMMVDFFDTLGTASAIA
jgi:adenine/guanine/hypoxanthine permease